MAKILVAMSGGVDSSAVAARLVREGHEVAGGTLVLREGSDACGTLGDVEDAAAVCQTLGIPHFCFDYRDRFKTEVMARFAAVYRAGETPNPCILCNSFVKFPAMLREAERLGFETVATGHYARIGYDHDTDRFLLLRPTDADKDQTYVLYGLTQDQLAHLVFPLGEMTDKAAVRALAKASGLGNADKPDSQDICFVPDGDYDAFIERLTGEKEPKATYVTEAGERRAAPFGLSHYTVGQRKGLGVAFGKPQFVLSKNAATGEVFLGEEDKLFARSCLVDHCNFISVPTLTAPRRVTAKTRYRGAEAPATVELAAGTTVKLTFDDPQRAITPGQAAVFYEGNRVLGGGTIRAVLS